MPVDLNRSLRPETRPVVVAGGGAAGINAALACRRHFPETPVTIVDTAAEIGYYRPLLPQFMLGKIDAHKLFFWRQGQDPLLALRLNTNVASIDRDNCWLHLEDGETLAYDRLILAPGGRPLVPPVCTSQSCRLGVFPVRSLADAKAVRRWLPGRRNITILGGGLVGVKTAVQFAFAGYPTILVEREEHLLPNLLARQATLPIADHLRNLGVDIRTASTIEDIRGDTEGDLKEVRISGDWTLCDTLLVAIGSTPELGFLESSGLLESGELVVAPTLRTFDRRVFAAGDAVTIRTVDGVTARPWTWPQAISQGKLAGANVYRSAPLALSPLSRVNAQNIAGLPLVVLGGRPDPFCPVSEFGDPPRWWREWYRKKERIVGGALVGDISGAGPLHFKMATGEIMPVHSMISDPKTGDLKPELLGERVLSAIIELQVKRNRLAFVLQTVKAVAAEVKSVFCLDICTRLEPGLQVPQEILDIITAEGFAWQPNAKINLGLGRTLKAGK